MRLTPLPLLFEPLFKPKPWGGRRLATLLNKPLPPGDPIGESWELVSLPETESRVRGGPLAGRTLAELVDLWGTDLLGSAKLADGRFPLLIKFLDAREDLSVQVHPRPTADGGWQPGLKHEAWHVIHAEPDARLYIGLKPGVGPEDVAHAANTPAVADLLRPWPVTAGECYSLPSGTPHALGADIVVAEVQTPSDVTYRLYDWGRVGLDGRPRALHIDEALVNIRYDVTEAMVRQSTQTVSLPFGPATRIAQCDAFAIHRMHQTAGEIAVPSGTMRIWIMLAGSAHVAVPPHATATAPTRTATVRERPARAQAAPRGSNDSNSLDLSAGDVVLFPAAAAAHVTLPRGAEWLDVTVP